MNNFIFLAEGSGIGGMGSTIAKNMIAFAKSMPTNLVILTIILLIMHFLFKKKLKDCLFVVLGYLLLGVLLGIFGWTMPNFLEIADWIKKTFSNLW